MKKPKHTAATDEIIKYIRRVLENAKGDDLERATEAFRGYAPYQMEQQHGHSGKTRQEILDGYRQDRELANRALEFFNALVAK